MILLLLICRQLKWTLCAFSCAFIAVPSVLWHCWLVVRKSIQPVNIDWWGVGVVICLERGADYLHMVQLMPLPSQNPICPGKEAVKQVLCSSIQNVKGVTENNWIHHFIWNKFTYLSALFVPSLWCFFRLMHYWPFLLVFFTRFMSSLLFS